MNRFTAEFEMDQVVPVLYVRQANLFGEPRRLQSIALRCGERPAMDGWADTKHHGRLLAINTK